jgi:NTP pyrophosphatase (non-canonical NTP hydrolase)
MQELMQKLRAANNARQKVWPGAEHVDLAFSTIEFGGEAGEAVEAAYNFTSSPLLGEEEFSQLKQAYTEEVGDVIISLDLLAQKLGIPLTGGLGAEWVGIAPQHQDSDTTYIIQFAGKVGVIMDGVKKYLRNQRRIFGNTVDAAEIKDRIGKAMNDALFLIFLSARDAGINAYEAVPMKFNKTSAKVGIPCFMSLDTWETQVTA